MAAVVVSTSSIPARAATLNDELMAAVFSSFDNSPQDDIEEYQQRTNYRRMDESDDGEFYTTTRFVEHIDEKAVLALISYHEAALKETAKRLYGDENRLLDVIDLCASHVSHLPKFYLEDRKPSQRIVGVGMNGEELRQNKVLSEFLVQDLNKKPSLTAFSDSSFDVCLIQLSIDYLTSPIDVLTEVSRILRPGGLLVVSFSNRLFLTKAIAAWTGRSDLDHVERVGGYIRLAKTKISEQSAFNLKSLKAAGSKGKRGQDPLFVVTVETLM